MKLRLTTFVAIVLLMTGLSGFAQDFDSVYPATEFAVKFGPQLYYGAIRPVWTGPDTFVYTTNEPNGDAWYRMTGTKKEPIDKATYEEAVNKNRRGYHDPSDDSQYAVRKEVRVFSSDSAMVAYVKDRNVWVSRADGSEACQLSFDGTEGFAYVEIKWSPDGKKLAALRKQEFPERQIILRESRPEDQIQPRYRYLDYAKPGDRLPQSVPALFDVASRQAIPLDRAIPMDQYFLFLGRWSPDSRFFTYEYNQRGHQLYELAAVDAASGKVSTLAKEETDTFVYYYDLWRYFFNDGKRCLWISERDDWRHLYLIDTHTREMRQLTKGAWNVREIHHVDEKGGFILANANGLAADRGEDPYNKHVIRIDIKTGKVTDLTPENANHAVSFNKEFTTFVDSYSRPDLPATTVLRDAKNGKVLTVIQKQDIAKVLDEGFTMPEVFKAKGRDGVTDIWGTIYRPFHFDPAKQYPVVEYIYAGPHDSHVDKNFMAYPPRFYRLLELGFIVVTIDGMGTDNRSKSFQDVAWRDLKDAGFPDRIRWIQDAAKKYPYMNLDKMGIYGYSAGGQNAMAALLFHPEFYKVGVALCGCHDNRMDKIWWNEQWMGYPIGPWYGESSNVDNAWRLEGKLLLINGEMDDNVDPASTLQVVAELINNKKDFEQLYIPGYSHNLGADWITRRIYEFFYRYCR
ncbi:MAG: DPP IV N-terminal domain-containing protein [Bacteroidales bacterium]|nr:DPP IV N-terminal domain-containing protein [Bacteroidales bacterium]